VQQFSDLNPIHMRKCIKPVNAGYDTLHFEVVQATRRQNELSNPKLACQRHTFPMNIPES
jgi:hypothetical protein